MGTIGNSRAACNRQTQSHGYDNTEMVIACTVVETVIGCTVRAIVIVCVVQEKCQCSQRDRMEKVHTTRETMIGFTVSEKQ